MCGHRTARSLIGIDREWIRGIVVGASHTRPVRAPSARSDRKTVFLNLQVNRQPLFAGRAGLRHRKEPQPPCGFKPCDASGEGFRGSVLLMLHPERPDHVRVFGIPDARLNGCLT